MKILIFGINYAPEEAGTAIYTTGFAEDLVRRGHDVTILCAPPHFPSWQVKEGFSPWRYQSTMERGVRVIRCPTYVPQVTTSTRRIVHYLSFTLSSFPAALWRVHRVKPEIVFCIAPALLSACSALPTAKIIGARTWLHIQDFEIEAGFATGVFNRGLAARFAGRMEAFLLRQFDRVSSISSQMLAKLAAKDVDRRKIVEFRNWSDLKEITPLTRPSSYRETWKLDEPIVALYSGSIGNKQGIELIVDAARLLQSRDDLVFIICGEGPNRARLEKLATDLTNVRFYDLQPRANLNELLGLATVHLLPQLAGAEDNFLPSKLTNILASGRPVIATALPGTSLHKEVQFCGLTPRPGDSEALAAAISQLVDNPERCEQLGKVARTQAEDTINSATVLDRVHTELANLQAVGA